MTNCDCTDRSAIERLLADYAWHVDRGEFEAFAELFRHGTWNGKVGYEATLTWLRDNVILYDGVPLTHHVISNLAIDIDASGDRATARSYITVFQRTPSDDCVRVVTANSYDDVLVKRPEGWTFEQRLVSRWLVGDFSRHLHPQPRPPAR
jgi:3-phenylpropionate/cinnamic acid dioxygenase small subunit